MRRIEREDLPVETANALQQLQQEVEAQREQAGFVPSQHWEGKRKSPTILAVNQVLKRMAGPRKRCMYCVDSAATDIEHFWPKTPHPGRMYVWENLLIACTQCGRLKSTKFPRTADGTPLLIDPSAEDPWEFLDFDPVTGNLNARYLLPAESFSVKGETTVTVLHLNSREEISVGYLRTYRRLCKLVTQWANQHLSEDYLDQLREADDHALLGWFLHGSGQNEPSFTRFRELHPDAWVVCRQLFP